jgi:hypothetical protein
MKLAPDFGITGYTDRWTYRPGERVRLHASARHPSEVVVRLHRFRQLVPDGPGLDLLAEPVPGVELRAMVQPQVTRPGSWLEIEDGGRLGCPGSFTLAFLLMPTRIGPRQKAVLAQATAETGMVLSLEADATLVLEGGSARLSAARRSGGRALVGAGHHLRRRGGGDQARGRERWPASRGESRTRRRSSGERCDTHLRGRA